MSHSMRPLVPAQQQLGVPHVAAAHLKSLVIALTSPFAGNSTNSRREIIRPIADDIAESGDRPEQMLKDFKALLNEAALRARIPFGSESTSILERYVSVFIEELYRSGRISEDGACRGKTVDGARTANTSRPSEVRP
jgi:hypothetical protein